jgi:glycosyltransferase involved in cell wall biosynthesis
VRFAVISTKEEKTPPLRYGGIERLVYDLGKALNADIFGVPRTDDVMTYDDINTNYDAMFDFSHQKYFQNLDSLVFGVPFHPDPASLRYNMYTTRVIASMYKLPGFVCYPGVSYIDKSGGDEGYLLFLGRFSEIKRPDLAIEVAKKLGRRIILAGHVGKFSDGYYARHLMRRYRDGVEYRINVDDDEKYELLSHASALLMPSDWRSLSSIESLGIVAMEAMVSGCPVITSGEGTSELLSFGKEVKTGVLMDGGVYCKHGDIDCFVNGVNEVNKINRDLLRKRAREFFSVNRWAEDVKRVVSGMLKGSELTQTQGVKT